MQVVLSGYLCVDITVNHQCLCIYGENLLKLNVSRPTDQSTATELGAGP